MGSLSLVIHVLTRSYQFSLPKSVTETSIHLFNMRKRLIKVEGLSLFVSDISNTIQFPNNMCNSFLIRNRYTFFTVNGMKIQFYTLHFNLIFSVSITLESMGVCT